MEDSPLVDKINPNMTQHMEENANVKNFVTPTKHWDTNSLVNILPNHMINKIIMILLPIYDLKDRIK